MKSESKNKEVDVWIFVWLQDASVGHDSHSSGGLQIFHCMYCGASFPHQSKLTRHILSHSLETLKYRETSLALQLSSFPHDAHFGPRPGLLDTLDPSNDASLENFDFAAAAAAAAAAAMQAAAGANNSSAGSAQPNNDQGSVVLCKFCGKSFPDVSSLITHLPVHTGDRPFKCEFCGKAFKLRHHMKDHCRVHTGECPAPICFPVFFFVFPFFRLFVCFVNRSKCVAVAPEFPNC